MTGPIYLWDIYLKTIKLSTKYIKMHVREIIDISYFIQLPTTRFYTSLRSTSADLELKKKNNDFSTDMTIIWQPCKIMMHIFFIFFHGNFVTILGKPGQKSVYWPRDKTTDDRVSSPAPPPVRSSYGAAIVILSDVRRASRIAVNEIFGPSSDTVHLCTLCYVYTEKQSNL